MKRYRVVRIDGEMVVEADRKGNYRASSPSEIKRALSELEYQPTTAEVLIGRTWYSLKRKKHSHRTTPNIDKRRYSTPDPIKPMSRRLRILRRLHLYKDPLDVLIYKGQ